jgi:hypothetical protein
MELLNIFIVCFWLSGKNKKISLEPLIIERRQMQTSVSLGIMLSLVELYSTA